MQRALCESCGKPQPREWTAGALCAHCGSTVRREVRCAWCTSFSPWPPGSASAFCRECGCGLVPPERYGAARMLKEAGVDRLSLAKRLAELDPGQLETFAAIYAKQAALVAVRVDECRFVESFLLQKAFSGPLEDELVATIPADKEALAALASGPKPPFDVDVLLRRIAAESPVRLTRTLAQIARLERPDIDEAAFSAALASATYGYGPIAFEAAVALSRPRARATSTSDSGGSIPHLSLEVLDRMAEMARPALADPVLAPWAAVVIARSGELPALIPWHERHEQARAELESLRAPLLRGLDSSDSQLRFAAALALRDETRLREPPVIEAEAESRQILAEAALARPGSPAPRLLVDMAAHGPDSETCTAAACALAALGGADRRTLERLLSSTWRADGPDALRAALAFGHWRVRASEAVWLEGTELARLAKIATPALDDRRLAPWAALVLALPLEEELRRRSWSGHEEAKRRLEALTPALRDGLATADPDLSFSCALALRDAGTLAMAIDDADEAKARLARRAVASTQEGLAERVFRAGPDAPRLDALPALAHPVGEPTMRALLDGIAASDGEFRERGLDFLHRSIRFEQHDPGVRALLGAFFRERATDLKPERVMAVLSWACTPVDSSRRPREDAEVKPFVAAATLALQAAPAEALATLVQARDGWLPWMHNAGETEIALLARWVREPALRDELLEKIHFLHGQLDWEKPQDLRARDLLVAVWDRAGDDGRAALAPSLAKVIRGAAQHREGYFAMFWERFKTRPEERDALLIALASCERELEEASANDGLPLAGRDPAATFRLLYGQDRSALYELTKRALKDLAPEGAPSVLAAIVEAATDFILENVLTALAAFELLASWIATRAVPENEGLADLIEAGYRTARQKAFDHLPAEKTHEHYFESKCERIDADLAKARRDIDFAKGAEARAAEEAARLEREAREAERRRQEIERAKRDAEEEAERARRAAEAEAARLREEAERRLREAAAEAERRMRDAAAETERRLREMQDAVRALDEGKPRSDAPLSDGGQRETPRVPPEAPGDARDSGEAAVSSGNPLDREVLLPEQPLKTLAEYVGFMKALSAGANAVELMGRHGMDVQRYSQCAIAWGQLMTTRSEVAVRFGQLMQAR